MTLEGTFGAGWNKLKSPDETVSQPKAGSATGDGGTSAGSTTVGYSLSRDRFGLNASHVLNIDYYTQFTDHRVQIREIATAAVYFVPSPYTRVTLSEGFKNLPEYSYLDLLPPEVADVAPVDQNVGVTVDRFRRFGSSVDVSQKLSRHSRVDLSLGYARGTITSGRKWTTLLYQGDFTQRLTKGLDVFAGYAYGEQRYEDLTVRGVRDRHPTMTFGIGYNRALSFTRRTTLAFSTGLSEIHDRVQNQTTYYLIGGAALKREFGRSWDTALVYNRNVRYLDALAVPLLNDAVALVVHGSFSRRIQLKSALSASRGQLGASRDRGFDTRYSTVQLSIAMTRYLALGTDYSYSELPTVRGSLPDSSGQLNGQSVRVNLQLWVPLLSQRKR